MGWTEFALAWAWWLPGATGRVLSPWISFAGVLGDWVPDGWRTSVRDTALGVVMPAWMVPLVVPILSLPVSLLLVLVVLLSVGTVSHLCRTAGCGAHIIYDWATSPFV